MVKELNITHNYLKELEDKGKLNAIITQNIDGLHQKAYSKNVLGRHDSILNNYCYKCGKNMMNLSYKRILAPYFVKDKLAIITKKDYKQIAKAISKYYLFK